MVGGHFSRNLQKQRYMLATRVLESGNLQLDVNNPQSGCCGDTGNIDVKSHMEDNLAGRNTGCR